MNPVDLPAHNQLPRDRARTGPVRSSRARLAAGLADPARVFV